MKVGYARVSTDDQTTALQIDALKAAGCERIFEDQGVSGVVTKRPQLDRCLNSLQAGDVLVVWKLDRLGRSVLHLVRTINELESQGIKFQSLTDHIDTSTPQGKFQLHVLAAVAELDRSLILERTKAGRTAAMKRGVRFGRPVKLTAQQRQHARELRDQGKTANEIAGLLGIGRSTAYRVLA